MKSGGALLAMSASDLLSNSVELEAVTILMHLTFSNSLKYLSE